MMKNVSQEELKKIRIGIVFLLLRKAQLTIGSWSLLRCRQFWAIIRQIPLLITRSFYLRRKLKKPKVRWTKVLVRNLRPLNSFRRTVSILLSGTFLICIVKLELWLLYIWTIFSLSYRNHPSIGELPFVPSNKTPKKSSPVGNDDFGSKSATKGKKK